MFYTRLTFVKLVSGLILLTSMLFQVQAAVLIASASSVRAPLDEIVMRYRQRTQVDIEVSYGASGNLAHQVLRGAPYEVFLSANVDFPARIEAAGYHLKPAIDYAVGQLVLFANTKSACDVENGVSGLPNQLDEGVINRVAIANPELAPYGIAAKQAMQNVAVWKRLNANLAFGNSVAQAAQFALSGAADCAVISMSLALDAGLNSHGRFKMIDSRQHSPIKHQMILLKSASAEAQVFFSFLQSPEVAEIFARYGFKTPEKGLD